MSFRVLFLWLQFIYSVNVTIKGHLSFKGLASILKVIQLLLDYGCDKSRVIHNLVIVIHF